MRLPFSIFFFTSFLYFPLFSSAQDIHFNVVARSQDDLGSQITEMTQDTQGYLWIATQSGLYKYDGYQYSSYHNEPLNPNSPAFDNIWCVTADKEGYIWIGTSQAGLDRLDPATGIFTHFRHDNNDSGSLSSDIVLTITEDREGTLWIGTLGGLDRLDRKSNKFLHYRNNANDLSSISCNVVMSIYEDKQGTLWVGTGTAFKGYDSCGGLNKLNKKTGTFTRYLHNEKDPHSLIDNSISAIFEDSRGTFWVGTAGDGLHTMDRAKGTFERHLYDPEHLDKLSRPPVKNEMPYVVDHIRFIKEDAKGRIWIGTLEGGINVYDPSTGNVSHYGADSNSREKLASNDFWTAYKTKDNVIWVSTWEGNLYKVIPYQNNWPSTRTGKIVLSFAEDEAQGLWIGTDKGLIHKYNNGKEEQFLINKDSTSPSNHINYIEKDGSKLWLSTFHGLFLFDPVIKTYSLYHHQAGNVNSLPSDTVAFLKKDTGSLLWIMGNNYFGVMDTKTNAFKNFVNDPSDSGSISTNNVNAFNIDKKQNVWVATANGLNRLDKQTGHFKKYLNQLAVYGIIEDSGGYLWVGSNSGLFRYNKEADDFLNFTDASGILSTSLAVVPIGEDQEQNIWLFTPKGLMRLDKAGDNVVLYGKNQGIDISKLTGLSPILKNGGFLLRDSTGYFSFNPKLFQQNSVPPSVFISTFLLNNVAVHPAKQGILTAPLMQTKEIRLPYNQNTFSFQFANIDFVSAHEDTRLLYMLQNYDNTWRKAGDERTAYYFNLPPGNYVFKVKAYNAAGIAAEKDIAVIITPPWWHTWWAYTLFALVFIGLVWAFIAYRSATLKRENKVLEEKVEHRTEQLKQSLENLKAAQTQLIQSEKMASLGELTAGIAHEIQNPLNFVNNFSELNTELIDELQAELKSGSTEAVFAISNTIKQNEQKINQNGKRADGIVKAMLQHSRTTKGEKQPANINALADEYLRLSYHGMRAKDKSFNAVMKTELDGSLGNIDLVPQDIGRVLLNLFNNAFYAVHEKMKKLGGGYQPTVTVSTKMVDAKVEIRVQDNGMGISKSVQDKIFQPFFTTKPTGEGTGLGLSLSYDIVKAHGGQLTVESKEGEGSTFVIILPLS